MPRVKLAGITISQLKAELTRRQKALPRLERKRAKLAAALDAIDRQIADLAGEEIGLLKAVRIAGAAKGSRRERKSKRAPRPGSLKAILLAAMAGKKCLGVAEAVQAALDGGYVTQSKNFRLLVNQTLLNEPEFLKVGRGKFTAK